MALSSHANSVTAKKGNNNIVMIRRLRVFIGKPFTLCSNYSAITPLAPRTLDKNYLRRTRRHGAGCGSGLKHPKEVQYDENDGDNEQSMNPIPGAREAWTYVPTEKAEQPQDYQNHDNSPHEISPFD
jgi:hypothetical protein